MGGGEGLVVGVGCWSASWPLVDFGGIVMMMIMMMMMMILLMVLLVDGSVDGLVVNDERKFCTG